MYCYSWVIFIYYYCQTYHLLKNAHLLYCYHLKLFIHNKDAVKGIDRNAAKNDTKMSSFYDEIPTVYCLCLKAFNVYLLCLFKIFDKIYKKRYQMSGPVYELLG